MREQNTFEEAKVTHEKDITCNLKHYCEALYAYSKGKKDRSYLV